LLQYYPAGRSKNDRLAGVEAVARQVDGTTLRWVSPV
jgi:hypothetical protein